MPICASFSLFLSFLYYKIDRWIFADVGMWTADFLCWKRPLCQLCQTTEQLKVSFYLVVLRKSVLGNYVRLKKSLERPTDDDILFRSHQYPLTFFVTLQKLGHSARLSCSKLWFGTVPSGRKSFDRKSLRRLTNARQWIETVDPRKVMETLILRLARSCR